MDLLGDALVIGLTEQAPLVLAAIGFALLYRLTGLINVAYSETVTLGAYLGMWVNTNFGASFYGSLIPAGLLAGLVSVGTYFVVFRPAKRRNAGVLEMIIISFGLSILLRYGLQFIFGYANRYYDVPLPGAVEIMGVGVSSFRILALVSVFILAILISWFIQRSSYGLKIRALASDEDLAQVSGIRPLAVTVMIWFLAGAIGGLAGAFYGVGSSARPYLGWEEFLFILLVVLVAGSKNLRNVIVVGAVTGVALTAVTLQFGQRLYAQLVLIVAFMLFLKWRRTRVPEMGKV
ncbi:MAG: hypothetical protein GEU79_02270 [Acidimicrobiia bacterium]|nr:hypothetical protein [Acidimicrobiia bacterium]